MSLAGWGFRLVIVLALGSGLIVAATYPDYSDGIGNDPATPTIETTPETPTEPTPSPTETTPTQTETPTPTLTPTPTPTVTPTPNPTPTPTQQPTTPTPTPFPEQEHVVESDAYDHVTPTHPDDPGRSMLVRGNEVEFDSGEMAEHFHELINQAREDEGLEPLKFNETISSVSRAHSWDMYHRDFFDHENPDGESPQDRYEVVASSCGIGENIHWHRPPRESSIGSAEYAFESLMDSEPHKENILREEYDEHGVGFYIAADGTIKVTQKLCVRDRSRPPLETPTPTPTETPTPTPTAAD